MTGPTTKQGELRTLGIRREDKSRWERRAPLTPENVRTLREAHGITTIVQPSPIRVFRDDAYRDAGAIVQEDLSTCNLVVAVKEIPKNLLRADKAYLFFSHTIKAQPYNMPMLGRILDLRCTLMDHERILDGNGRRLVRFSYHAGLTGMLDSLWALGRRLAWEGVHTPFERVQPAHTYPRLAAALNALREIGDAIRTDGLPPSLGPVVVGFAGYGEVSRGAQHVFDAMNPLTVRPSDLPGLAPGRIYKVVFREEDTVEPIDGSSFELQTFYAHPDRFRPVFERYLDHLTVLVNCIYWDVRYPRLVTLRDLAERFGKGRTPRLRVIGDISCDIDGGIEATVKATSQDEPVYVYDPVTRKAVDGVEGDGPVIMAVDNLPCELPRDATESFGQALVDLLPAAVTADYRAPFDGLALPPELKVSVIAHAGELTPDYRYLEPHPIRGLDKPQGGR